MLDLQLEAAVEPVRPPLGGDVARGQQLELEEAERLLLGRRKLLGAQVRHQQLHMQNADERVVQHNELEPLAVGRQQQRHESPEPEEVGAHGEHIPPRARAHRVDPRDGQEVVPANCEDDGQEGDVLHAHEQLDAAPRESPRDAFLWQLCHPAADLLGRLQPERKVGELRVLVRPQRVGVVGVVLVEPHGRADAEHGAGVELAKQVARGADAAPGQHAVVQRVMAQKGGLLQRERKEDRSENQLRRTVALAPEHAHTQREQRSHQQLLARVEPEARLEGALLPQLLPQRPVVVQSEAGGSDCRRSWGGLTGCL
mmetsp:Transcript_46578/g.101206  ORF Transcript_46578/g.101206 Transcript_46578/m.101206 type:complete len:313 (-) Transcript_46578:2339-3277(-)|eukprot:6175181-Pleurochrysis_carterae.AAC.4